MPLGVGRRKIVAPVRWGKQAHDAVRVGSKRVGERSTWWSIDDRWGDRRGKQQQPPVSRLVRGGGGEV
ncbi:hypothetical protein GUJ93_ZPchr0004g39853 [Zizania palustris]|uniref:Uncharacterized protein n=1 Tax=Zizania palustris TaxID=103762 RepID=A0A8J5V8Z4_ZIZPA|nr:hypothetical protein GUJ93_ZPchr0004g39853 [Zizania palustris]